MITETDEMNAEAMMRLLVELIEVADADTLAYCLGKLAGMKGQEGINESSRRMLMRSVAAKLTKKCLQPDFLPEIPK